MGGLLDTESCPSVVDDLYWFPKHGLNVRLFLQGTVHFICSSGFINDPTQT